MNNLIVTAGILIFMITLTGMQNQLNQVILLQRELQYAAEEAAATAALSLDREAFGEGYLRFDREGGRKAAKEITEKNLKEPFSMDVTYGEGRARPWVRVIIRSGKQRAVGEYEYVSF